MNEIFSIHRFSALWIKFHREHLKTNLIFVAMMAVVTFLCLCKFNPFVPEYKIAIGEIGKANFLGYYKEVYREIFWGLLFFFSMFAAIRSFKDFMSPHKAMGALLLPASSFEKYLLAFLNSTVILFVVYFVIFYGMAGIVNTYKYAGAEELINAQSWLGINVRTVTEGQEVIRPVVGNVLDIRGRNFSAISPVLLWNLVVIGWVFFVSLFMWGSITFRKRAILSTLLIHLLVFIGWGYLLYRMIQGLIDTFSVYQERVPTPIEVIPGMGSQYLLLILYIFPLAYLWVIWLKLKNKQLN